MGIGGCIFFEIVLYYINLVCIDELFNFFERSLNMVVYFFNREVDVFCGNIYEFFLYFYLFF